MISEKSPNQVIIMVKSFFYTWYTPSMFKEGLDSHFDSDLGRVTTSVSVESGFMLAHTGKAFEKQPE